MSDNKVAEQFKFNTFTNAPKNGNSFINFNPVQSVNPVPSINPFPVINPIPSTLQTNIQEPPRPLTRKEILDKEITDSIRDLILVFQKCKIITDDINNENEKNKMMKIIEVYYESCNNEIVKLVLGEIYKGLKKETYLYTIKYEDMEFDIPDFTYVCFRDYVKKQFDKMQFHINKYY
jgi:hypothetical protein